jgi:DNA-3-methyladenine glycosylase II
MPNWNESIQKSVAYLSANDKMLAKIIAASELPTFKPHKNYYQELVESIIGQQLSVNAARSITTRFKGLFGDMFPSPEQILEKSVEELRTAGLSNAKAKYVRDLAQHVVDGKVKFGHLDALPNEAIISELTDVKGIGEWSAHMFLIFCMGRLDVLAHGDLGIRTGIQRLYKLPALPSTAEVDEIALKNNWHPYESVACWYVWKSIDTV